MINSTVSYDASAACIIEILIYSELFARNALTNKEPNLKFEALWMQ